MALGDAPHDGEPESRAALRRGLSAVEAVEDALALRERDAPHAVGAVTGDMAVVSLKAACGVRHEHLSGAEGVVVPLLRGRAVEAREQTIQRVHERLDVLGNMLVRNRNEGIGTSREDRARGRL